MYGTRSMLTGRSNANFSGLMFCTQQLDRRKKRSREHATPLKKLWLKNDTYTFHSIATTRTNHVTHLDTRMEGREGAYGGGRCTVAGPPKPKALRSGRRRTHFAVTLPAAVSPCGHRVSGQSSLCLALNILSSSWRGAPSSLAFRGSTASVVLTHASP